MAATKLISGILREIWQEGAPGQAGGPSQVFTTGIRIDVGSLSRVRALLVVDSIVGGAIAPVVTADAPNGFLRFAVAFSGNPAVIVTWTLDVQLTHSIQQARDPDAGAYIAVVNGGSVGGLLSNQTLAQTYDYGTVAVDQRIVVDTARGGGVVIEASTAAVTADGVSLNVRQHATWAVPVLVERASAVSNNGPSVQFRRSQGTLAAPTQVAANDTLGVLSFYGYTAGAFGQYARIYTWVPAVAPGPGFELSTAIDFEVTAVGVTAAAFRITKNGAAGGGVLTCLGDGIIGPDVDNQGQVGSPVGISWAGVSAYHLYAQANIHIGDYISHGATHALILQNDSTLPVPTSNTVFVGSQDFAVGAFHAVLAISAEELAIEDPAPVTHGIPIRYNGQNFYLHAGLVSPG